MTKYVGEDAILIEEDKAVSIPVMVDDTSHEVDEDGNHYLMAGTWLGTDGDDVTLTKKSVVMKPTSDPKQVQGILLHDTNVVRGPKIAALVITGYISRKLIDETTKQKYYTDDQIHSLKSSMPRLTILDK